SNPTNRNGEGAHMQETQAMTLDAGIPTDATFVGTASDRMEEASLLHRQMIAGMKSVLALVTELTGEKPDKVQSVLELLRAGYTAAEVLDNIDEAMAP